ncbi:hypothetical protein NZ09_00270 [Listeria monocytogenes]|nr:hypothetical protein [Listeria monocytogenes]EAD0776622.1 hypothetical protein [Listeria monocytogenes]EAD6807879.1 hypothetical protein [Listeria monocytogenes]EAD9739950.1 hypothetical protein [Listeria monocytogenes]
MLRFSKEHMFQFVEHPCTTWTGTNSSVIMRTDKKVYGGGYLIEEVVRMKICTKSLKGEA